MKVDELARSVKRLRRRLNLMNIRNNQINGNLTDVYLGVVEYGIEDSKGPRVEIQLFGAIPDDLFAAEAAAEEIVGARKKYVHGMESRFKLYIRLIDIDDGNKTATLIEEGLDCPF